MRGQCKLCLKNDVELKKSHYLPAGIYKGLRDETKKNPNPVLISRRGAVQTSRQKTAPLLCSSCEQRFSKNGENWVLHNCLQKDGSFPLMSILSSRIPDLLVDSNPTRVYYASCNSEVNISALAYFAISIFWRGAVYGWNEDGSVPIKLGPFQEQFRQYLMGLSTFPDDCSLLLVVREGKEVDRITYEPVELRMGNFRVHRFPMPGFLFLLAVSKNLPSGYREKCFVRGFGNPIVVTAFAEQNLMMDMINMLTGISSRRK